MGYPNNIKVDSYTISFCYIDLLEFTLSPFK